jgi:hypothetical protein
MRTSGAGLCTAAIIAVTIGVLFHAPAWALDFPETAWKPRDENVILDVAMCADLYRWEVERRNKGLPPGMDWTVRHQAAWMFTFKRELMKHVLAGLMDRETQEAVTEIVVPPNGYDTISNAEIIHALRYCDDLTDEIHRAGSAGDRPFPPIPTPGIARSENDIDSVENRIIVSPN